MNGIDGSYASPAVRDGFLSALDRRDGVTLGRLARGMTGCGNPLPSTICAHLGVPVGSTYGFAARRIVAEGTEACLAAGAPVLEVDPSPTAGAPVAGDAIASDGRRAIASG